MTPRFRFAPGGRKRLLLLDNLLDDAFGAPESEVGNHLIVLDEAIYIILSFQPDLSRLQGTWRRLTAAFPRWEDAARAPVSEIADVMRAGGLHQQKAKVIKRLLAAVRDEFGEFSLAALRQMEDSEAEKILTRLPGLSWKGARCVLLYSLRRDVFPVDGNTFRILRRAGVIAGSSVYRRKSLHDALQAAVPADRRRPFHVNLVIHSQRVCVPGIPRCSSCPALHACRRCGLQPLKGPHGRVGAHLECLEKEPASVGSGSAFSQRARPLSRPPDRSRAREVGYVASAD